MKKIIWVLINLFGGSTVIGSYAYGFISHPNAFRNLWGGVPVNLQPLYTVFMFVAAAGYFAIANFILRLKPDETTIFNRFGFGVFNFLYILVLVPSALWMSLTQLAIEHSSAINLLIMRFDLALVAAGSLGLLIAVLTTQPRPSTFRYFLAVAGSAALCFQTVILDAVVWSIFFHG